MTTAVDRSAHELPTRDAVMAQAGQENFPVAALALGSRYRRHLLAIYGFARLADDTGDETAGDRHDLLEELRGELATIYSGGKPTHPVMVALRPTVEECRLPREPFLRLIEANEMDQVVTRYETFEQLLSYCHLSAAPVGELVLHVFGAATPARIELSNRACAGLQIVEHLQDVAEDRARGRIYLPAAILARHGCTELDLAAPSAGRGLRAAIAELARQSGTLIDAGVPMLRQLAPRPRLLVAGFVAGGRSTLAALERCEFDVLGTRPRRSRSGFALALAKAVSGR